jgi:hypothetical protein
MSIKESIGLKQPLLGRMDRDLSLAQQWWLSGTVPVHGRMRWPWSMSKRTEPYEIQLMRLNNVYPFSPSSPSVFGRRLTGNITFPRETTSLDTGLRVRSRQECSTDSSGMVVVSKFARWALCN